MDDAVDDGWERGQEVGRVDFRVEEDFRGEETLVTDIDVHASAVGRGHGVFEEAVGFAVVAREFLDDVRAHIAAFFLHLLGCLQATVRLAAVTEEVLDEIGDISAGDGYTLNRGADDVALCDGNNVGDTIT